MGNSERKLHSSFRKQDLVNLSLDNRDVRGLNFSHSKLINSSFVNVKAGQKKLTNLIQQVIWILTSLITGLIFQSSFLIITAGIHDDWVYTFTGLFLAFFYFTCLLFRGLGTAILASALSSTTTIVVSTSIGNLPSPLSNVVAGMTAGFIATAVSTIGVLLFFIALGSIVCLASTPAAYKSIASSVFSAIVLASYHPLSRTSSLISLIVSCLLIFASSYRAIKIVHKGNSSNSNFVYSIIIALTTYGGTSFRNANLTNTDFSSSVLKNTDFREADLTGVYWRDVKCLSLCRLGNSYLKDPKILKLVTTGYGQDQRYDGLNLHGINLKGANLEGASFARANLNDANLRYANLSKANLKQIQLDGADLTGATLTGAYIEDWGITSTTKLENVQCKYIYMRVPTKEEPSPLRKPDNLRETFAEGEFATFIQPLFNTLDLYHSQDVDPRAISIALRDLSANHPYDDLQFVAIERRGTSGVNLRFTTSPEADKSELNDEYFKHYIQIRKELESEMQFKLAEKDAEIRTLQGTIEQFIQAGVAVSQIGTTTLKEPVAKSILMLAANPKGTPLLRLGEEARELQAGLERSKYRDRYTLQHRWAVTPTEIRRALLNIRPSIVHFSGHGSTSKNSEHQALDSRKLVTVENTSETEGLMFEDETGQPQLVSSQMIADLFSLFSDQIECVVLNACFSEVQADAIAHHIPYVVGMRRAIGDYAAIQFSIGFYDALLAGESIEFAYKFGCSAIQMAGISEYMTPILKKRLR